VTAYKSFLLRHWSFRLHLVRTERVQDLSEDIELGREGGRIGLGAYLDA